MSKVHPGQSERYKLKAALFKKREPHREIQKKEKKRWLDRNPNIPYKRH